MIIKRNKRKTNKPYQDKTIRRNKADIKTKGTHRDTKILMFVHTGKPEKQNTGNNNI